MQDDIVHKRLSVEEEELCWPELVTRQSEYQVHRVMQLCQQDVCDTIWPTPGSASSTEQHRAIADVDRVFTLAPHVSFEIN